jgi:hypothetical protein
MSVGIKINKVYAHRQTRLLIYSCCLYFVIIQQKVARECIIVSKIYKWKEALKIYMILVKEWIIYYI